MKKITLLVLGILCCMLILSGCQKIMEIDIGGMEIGEIEIGGNKISHILCRHEWMDATCEVPESCAKCGKTEGEALGHNWLDATCVDPQTCSVCSHTEGKALGHSWLDASCEAPKTCSVCSHTEGNALGHNWLDATCEMPQTCSVCNAQRGATADHVFGSWKLNGVDADVTYKCEICGGTESKPFDGQMLAADLVRNTKWTLAALYDDGSFDYNLIDRIGRDYATLVFDDGYGVVDTFDGDTYHCVWKYVECSQSDSAYSFNIDAYTTDTNEYLDTYVIILDVNEEESASNPVIAILLSDGSILLYYNDAFLFGDS